LGIVKTFGAFIGTAITLVLLWEFLPVIQTLFDGVSDNSVLSDRELGTISLLPLIIVIIILLGSAAIIRSKLKR